MQALATCVQSEAAHWNAPAVETARVAVSGVRQIAVTAHIQRVLPQNVPCAVCARGVIQRVAQIVALSARVELSRAHRNTVTVCARLVKERVLWVHAHATLVYKEVAVGTVSYTHLTLPTKA